MFFPFKKQKIQPVANDFPESVRALFLKFRRIQKLNTKALEIMAEMDRVLGGEYIFDRAFMESSIRTLGELVYHIVYCINAMSGNRYIRLYDRFQEIRDVLDDILGGGMGPFAQKFALSYRNIGWELEPIVGSLNICLAEARYHLDIPAPDGFAVTMSGCDNFFRHARQKNKEFMNSDLGNAIIEEFETFLQRNSKVTEVQIRAIHLTGDDNKFHEISIICPATSEMVLATCCRVLLDYKEKNTKNDNDDMRVALAVHEHINAGITGKARAETMHGFPAGVIRITASNQGGHGNSFKYTESYIVKKIFPYGLIRSEIIPKNDETPFVKGFQFTNNGLQRGHALLRPEFLKSIAENAVKFWRMTGENHELAWIKKESGGPVFIDVKTVDPLHGKTSSAAQTFSEVYEAEIIISGGETVQSGASAGIIRHVREDDSLDSFPHGAIAVAKTASPRLFPFLRKASAFITEIGSPIGHLATVARELRVPSVFGLERALEMLPSGLEATVDASERIIYRGIVESVMAEAGLDAGLMPGDEEYASLRRLLRWITPLGLTDPNTDDYSASGCRTYHDIIHFAHESSVARLLGIKYHGAGDLRSYATKIELSVPLDLFLIDLGGAIASGCSDRIRIDQIESVPLKAFLSGINDREMWLDSPVPISFSDIVSGMAKMSSAAGVSTGVPKYSGTNHVIAADNYMNLGLLLGYHYTIVDSYFGSLPGQNYIYFRFAGGFADDTRKNIRAGFIKAVLEEMDFKVDIKADLVIGKLKMAKPDEMKRCLIRVGQLSAFTRQMDVVMTDSGIMENLLDEFRKLGAQ